MGKNYLEIVFHHGNTVGSTEEADVYVWMILVFVLYKLSYLLIFYSLYFWGPAAGKSRGGAGGWRRNKNVEEFFVVPDGGKNVFPARS